MYIYILMSKSTNIKRSINKKTNGYSKKANTNSSENSCEQIKKPATKKSSKIVKGSSKNSSDSVDIISDNESSTSNNSNISDDDINESNNSGESSVVSNSNSEKSTNDVPNDSESSGEKLINKPTKKTSKNVSSVSDDDKKPIKKSLGNIFDDIFNNKKCFDGSKYIFNMNFVPGFGCDYWIINDDDSLTIKYIFHLSDIHIRKSTRFDEYRHVFIKTCIKLQKLIGTRKNESLIVITGDIMHERNFSTESTSLFYQFLRSLNMIAPVLFIAGNHDVNMGVDPTHDNFTNLLPEGQGIERVYYCQYTGVYKYCNIMFGVTRVGDDNILPVSHINNILKKTKQRHDVYKIALFHGALNNVKMSDSYNFINHSSFNVNHFKGYDNVLLGDIHIYQFVGNTNIAYPGSLIQQDFSESLDNHGFLIWDLPESSTTFIKIKNNYGFHEIYMKDIPIKRIPFLKLSQISSVKIHCINNDKDEYNRYVKALRENNTIINSVPVYPLPKDLATININGTTIDNIDSIKNHRQFIDTYLGQINIDKQFIKEIYFVHDEVLSKINENSVVSDIIGSNFFKGKLKSNQFKILKLSFKNMMCYGDGNGMNIITAEQFKRYKKIGIVAANNAGKSSILDILLFCFFEDFSRSRNNGDIMNIAKDNAECSVEIKISDEIYRIKRVCVRGKSQRTVKPSLERLEDGKWILCSDNRKNNTNAAIEKLVGTYKDFVASSLMLQHQDKHHENSIINMTLIDKCNYFMNVLNLDIFNKCLKYIKKLIKDIKSELSNLTLELGKILGNHTFDSAKEKFNSMLRDFKSKQTKLLLLKENNVSEPTLETFSDLNKYQLPCASNFDTYKKPIIVVNKIIEKIKSSIHDYNIGGIDISAKINSYTEKIKNLKYEKSIKRLNSEICLKHGQLSSLKDQLKTVDNSFTLNELRKRLVSLNKSIKLIIDELGDSYNDNSDLDKIICSIESRVDELKPCIIHIKELSNTELIEERDLLISQLSEFDDEIDRYHNSKLAIDIKAPIINDIQSNVDILSDLSCSDKSSNKLLSNVISNLENIVISHNNKSEKFCSTSRINMKKISKRDSLQSRLDKLNIQISNNDEINSQYVINKERKEVLRKLLLDLKQYTQLRVCYVDKKRILSFIECIEYNSPIQKKIAIINDEINEINVNISNVSDQHSNLTKKLQRIQALPDELSVLKHDLELLFLYKSNLIDWSTKRSEFKKYTSTTNDLSNDIYIMKSDLKQLRNKLSLAKPLNDSIISFNALLKNYNIYKMMVHSTGLPHMILSHYVPVISAHANNFLRSIHSDLSVEFILEKQTLNRTNIKKTVSPVENTIDKSIETPTKTCKKKDIKMISVINIKINQHKTVRNSKGQLIHDVSSRVDDVSGSQQFIINIALRFAFQRVMVTPKSNWFIVDEGWSSLDSDNIQKIDSILNTFSNFYDHIILISHQDKIKKRFDYRLHICKDVDGHSHINNSHN